VISRRAEATSPTAAPRAQTGIGGSYWQTYSGKQEVAESLASTLKRALKRARAGDMGVCYSLRCRGAKRG
jgi:hypothetical protein